MVSKKEFLDAFKKKGLRVSGEAAQSLDKMFANMALNMAVKAAKICGAAKIKTVKKEMLEALF